MLELTIVVVIMGVLISYAMPRFQKSFEQSRVDLATVNLETIWTAQRLYWAQNRVFASSVGSLEAAGLIDPSFVNSMASPRAPFQYTITSADATSFQAQAERINSSHWRGDLFVNEQGALSGQVEGTAGEVVTPSHGGA